MPSPYAHMIAGSMLTMPRLVTSPLSWRQKEDIATLFLFSILPDLDAIPGLLTGNLPAYHNQITHTIAFGLGSCLAASALRRILPNAPSFRNTFALTSAAYGLHLLMDWFTPGRGLMLFWPLSHQRFASPFPLFYGLRHSDGLLSSRHIITFASESLTMLPLAALLWWFIHKRTSSTSIPQPEKPS